MEDMGAGDCFGEGHGDSQRGSDEEEERWRF